MNRQLKCVTDKIARLLTSAAVLLKTLTQSALARSCLTTVIYSRSFILVFSLFHWKLSTNCSLIIDPGHYTAVHWFLRTTKGFNDT